MLSRLRCSGSEGISVFAQRIASKQYLRSIFYAFTECDDSPSMVVVMFFFGNDCNIQILILDSEQSNGRVMVLKLYVSFRQSIITFEENALIFARFLL